MKQNKQPQTDLASDLNPAVDSGTVTQMMQDPGGLLSEGLFFFYLCEKTKINLTPF